ncbi:predicted protein [Nematostella vectensis]|uniref:Luciferin 4-monooxygenase n=1 Tax=Nematostella vectensis TaxID=45351 RepID=A7RP51_NEMVE|nr:4-coumarate--CoA ligase 1 [Nematostella vectensis]EDO46794.1 predicted protein [Nematostella vectensis]|eukprot:XP_001638857.1 predicted protein [Nematostella vectensis]
MAVLHSGFKDVVVPSDIHSFPRYVLKHMESYGEETAMVDSTSGRSYTYNKLTEMIKKCGSALIRQGLQTKDMVAVLLPNMPEYPIVFYGVTSVGGIVTTINPAYTTDEIIYQLKDSGAKYLVTVPQLAQKAKQAADQAGVKRIYTFGYVDGCKSLFDLLHEDDGGSYPVSVSVNWKEDVVCLPYSSGTTGLPKGVMLTHYNLIHHAAMFSNDDVMSSEDLITLGLLPMFHSYGLSILMGVCLIKGASVICMTQFEPTHFLEAIQKFKITMLPVVPPIVLFLAKHPLVEKYNLMSIKQVTSGAAPLGAEQINALMTRMPWITILRQGYGLTETSPAVTTSPLGKCKPGSVGVLLPGLKAKVIDLKTGALLPPNQDGEICVAGPTIMKGYYNNPEATAKTIDCEGWLHTGDVGHYDNEGHFYVVDRIKELIKYKGFQVPPAELEALLLSHPKITDAAVIGVPDDEAGELPKALVVTSGAITASEVQRFVAERVASHKRLRGGVEIVQSVPKNASGKILRRQLREREKERLALRHKL